MGFKKTSDLIAVSFDISESAPNTYTQEEIALQLDVLNNEIFVVLAVDLNCAPPDAQAGVDSATSAQVSSTTQANISNLGSTNILAVTERTIRAAGFVDSGVGFSHFSGETPTAMLDYIGLIATNNFSLVLLVMLTLPLRPHPVECGDTVLVQTLPHTPL